MPRHLALGLMIILGMYIVISLVAAADTIVAGSAAASAEQSVEDGQFSLFVPMNDTERQKLAEAGITVEAHFYQDYEALDGSVLRVSVLRETIDKAQADTGRLPVQDGEVLLEKRYCEEHSILVGDAVRIGGRSFTVCGIGTTPDYDAPYRNLSDSAVDSGQFGTAFVSRPDYESLKAEDRGLLSEAYVYAYLLHDKLTDRTLRELLRAFVLPADTGSSKLMQLIPAKDNARIGSAAADVAINKTTGLFAG